MIPTVKPDVEGLPEGCKLVRIGQVGPEDYELIGSEIYKGIRPNAASGVIVAPAKGYSFRVDIRTSSYVVVKTLGHFEGEKWIPEPLTITITAKYNVTNSYDRDTIKSALERLKEFPGCMGVEADGLS